MPVQTRRSKPVVREPSPDSGSESRKSEPWLDVHLSATIFTSPEPMSHDELEELALIANQHEPDTPISPQHKAAPMPSTPAGQLPLTPPPTGGNTQHDLARIPQILTTPTTPTPASPKSHLTLASTKEEQPMRKVTAETVTETELNPSADTTVNVILDNTESLANRPDTLTPPPQTSERAVSEMGPNSNANPPNPANSPLAVDPIMMPLTAPAAPNPAMPVVVPDLTSNSSSSPKSATASSSAPATTSDGTTIRRYLTAQHGGSGYKFIDEAIEQLYNNLHCVWIGHSKVIDEHCEWRINPMTRSSVLKWKESSPARPTGDGTVLVGYIGVVTAEGTKVACDAGWNTEWDAKSLPKQKRVICATWPDEFTSIPSTFFDTQALGMEAITQHGLIVPGKPAPAARGPYCFFQRENRTVKVRSNLFQPFPEGTIDNGSGEADDYEMEEDIPREYRYYNWNLGSPEVREVFNRVIKKGYEPQVMEVYSLGNRLIHPDMVESNLVGSIVMFYCTFEKQLFTGRAKGPNGEANIYSNLVKAQILKKPPPFREVSKKRKRASEVGTSGNDAAESSSSAKRGRHEL